MSRMKQVKIVNALQWLSNEHGLQYNRINDTQIYVWTSGYKTARCHEVESYLTQHYIRAVSQNFDKVCGKTCTIYNHEKLQ